MKQVSLIYIHFPLTGHRFAMPAARAAECAGNQGRFQAMYDQLFDGQDSFWGQAVDGLCRGGGSAGSPCIR
jgi:protein-disulfide isomerase